MSNISKTFTIGETTYGLVEPSVRWGLDTIKALEGKKNIDDATIVALIGGILCDVDGNLYSKEQVEALPLKHLKGLTDNIMPFLDGLLAELGFEKPEEKPAGKKDKR